ncbi:cytochrome C [Nitrosophilus labii]|uniref:cytochrome C n=1 Tax=Nitrosophilus labii TaxID=2706014 RepID=UPI001656CB35|nr:cytochrome C [Nitrosophilus labii]
MNSSSIKYKIFAMIAFGILLYWFVIPAVLTHNVPDLAKAGKADKIPEIAYKAWDFYQKGRYVSPNTPPEALDKNGNQHLKNMIKYNAEIGVASAPIWYVSLEAPNYPKDAFPEGIPVYYHFDGFSGDVHEMNTINHFIGMDPMERGAPYLRAIAPYVLVLLAFSYVLFILYDWKWLNYIMWIAVALPVIFLGFYAYWLYWFGHHMHDWGAFKIKPFMPTVFGDGKVAQFTTHSYPTIGFWLLLAISVFTLLAILSKNKYLKAKKVQ